MRRDACLWAGRIPRHYQTFIGFSLGAELSLRSESVSGFRAYQWFQRSPSNFPEKQSSVCLSVVLFIQMDASLTPKRLPGRLKRPERACQWLRTPIELPRTNHRMRPADDRDTTAVTHH